MAFIIPYFIQHQGCPHRCLFCDQTVIAGTDTGGEKNLEADLSKNIDLWLGRNRKDREVQVAFYGGSFTCLSDSLQKRLLGTVQRYIQAGKVHSARLSTRPDCISDTICRFLLDHGVKTVELGVQSMSNKVLQTAKRGHDAEASKQAAELLLTHGLELGIQLMPGLPGETTGSFLQGVHEVVEIKPDFVRIYPAVVIKNTGLAKLFSKTAWTPLSMNQAITLTRKARELFLGSGIRVIRMGLQPSEELGKQVLAGPYHPAFGELVIGRDWYLKMRRIMSSAGKGKDVCVTISDKDYSAFVGPGKQNINRLNNLYNRNLLVVETDKRLDRFQFRYVIK